MFQILRTPLANAFSVCALCLLLVAAPVQAATNKIDPLERINRGVFFFNETLDRWLILPLARGYRKVTPGVVDRGVTNFLSNLGELPAVLNDLLQLRPDLAVNDGGRFLINSTIGVFGILDVAPKFGLEKNYQDFGITFARWGMDPGPFVMLPLLGPSTLRDGLGWVPDIYLHPLQLIEEDRYRYPMTALRFIDARADLLTVDELISGDRYVFLRDAYLQAREIQITGEAPVDDFGEEDFDF